VTNGVVVLGWYGIAFIGGFVEQIGVAAGLTAVRNVGIVASLISPADSLWRFGAMKMVPAAARGIGPAGLFTGVSTPSVWALWWAGGFAIALLAWALRSFDRRAL
jgi:hypothetical protein